MLETRTLRGARSSERALPVVVAIAVAATSPIFGCEVLALDRSFVPPYVAVPRHAPAAPAALDEVIELAVGRSRDIDAPWSVEGAALTDPAVADVQVLTPEIVLVSGKAPGVTDLILWGGDEQKLRYSLRVFLDLEPIQGALSHLFPGGAVVVAQSGNQLLVRGDLPQAEDAERLRAYLDSLELPYVDMTRLPGVQQVQVEVRIAEVSRSGFRGLAVNGFMGGEDGFGGVTIGAQGGGPIQPISIGAPEGASVAGNVPFVFTKPVEVSPSVTLFGGIPNSDIEVFLSALAENQYLRILAEPNLVAMSGEEASFLAGGEFPIPVVQGGIGAGTSITIEYREFGVGLRFRPVVVGEGGIRLHVSAEVSELSDIGAVEIQGFQVPSILTRRTQTAVEMKSGQSFALAGLLNESTSSQSSFAPFLGQLPIIGPLFRSVRFRHGETELLVIVSASLVEPSDETEHLPMPGTAHLVPNDWELYMEGRLESRTPAWLAPDDARWLREIGLDQLKGPGAWDSHEREHARASTSTRLREGEALERLEALAPEAGAVSEDAAGGAPAEVGDASSQSSPTARG